MNIWRINLRGNNGGALLLAIVTAMVISFTAATLVAVMLNHSVMMTNEIERKKANYLVRAGFEYAYDRLYDGLSVPSTLPGYSDVNISVTSPDPDGLSDSKIEVWMDY